MIKVASKQLKIDKRGRLITGTAFNLFLRVL